MNEINKRICELREKLGLTLTSMAEKLWVSVSALSMMEKGERTVTERTIKVLLQAFPRVSETWLRDGDGPMFRDIVDDGISAAVATLDLPDIAQVLIDIYAQLPEDAQKAVVDYTRQVVAKLIRDTGIHQDSSKSESEHERLMRLIDAELRAEKDPTDRSQVSPGSGISAG